MKLEYNYGKYISFYRCSHIDYLEIKSSNVDLQLALISNTFSNYAYTNLINIYIIRAVSLVYSFEYLEE